MMHNAVLPAARSFLFVPGNRPELFLKAIQSGASLMAIWNHTCESAYGLAASSHRVVLASCGSSLV
ncbi:MAG: hypothetical protein EBR47_00745 [Betaproteobacteria bacterium]|nr:hypothetical protein [Betaproteobacteria bacterium]